MCLPPSIETLHTLSLIKNHLPLHPASERISALSGVAQLSVSMVSQGKWSTVLTAVSA